MNQKYHGFTVIEMIVAMVAGAVLAVTVGLMLSISYRSWIGNRSFIGLQREVTLAQTVVERHVRASSYANTTVTNNVVTVVEPDRTRRLYRSDDDLIYDPDITLGGDEMIISQGHVYTFLSWKTYMGVQIELLLKDAGTEAQFSTFTGFRN